MAWTYTWVMVIHAWLAAGTPSVITVFHPCSTTADWNHAAESCRSRGTTLVRLDSPAKVDAMVHILVNGFNGGTKSLYWTGLHRISRHGKDYAWQNCDILDRFSHWDNSSIDKDTAGNFCVAANTADQQAWSVQNCRTQLNYVCEETKGRPCTFQTFTGRAIDPAKYKGRQLDVASEEQCRQRCLAFAEGFAECWVYTYRQELCMLYADDVFGGIQNMANWINQQSWILGRKVCFSPGTDQTLQQPALSLAQDVPETPCWTDDTTTIGISSTSFRFTSTVHKTNMSSSLATNDDGRAKFPIEKAPGSLTSSTMTTIIHNVTTSFADENNTSTSSTVISKDPKSTTTSIVIPEDHETTTSFTVTSGDHDTTTDSRVAAEDHESTTSFTVTSGDHDTTTDSRVAAEDHESTTSFTVTPEDHETTVVSAVTPEDHETTTVSTVTADDHETTVASTVTSGDHETTTASSNKITRSYTVTPDAHITKAVAFIPGTINSTLNYVDENTPSSKSASLTNQDNASAHNNSTRFGFTSVSKTSTVGTLVDSSEPVPAETEIPAETTPCTCECKWEASFRDEPEELERLIAAIDIPTQDLSSTRRRRSCAEDNRMSSVSCGVMAVLIIVFTCGGLILSDIINLFQRILKYLENRQLDRS